MNVLSNPSFELPSAGLERRHVLWVKVGGLWPLTSGGRLRSFHLLAELSRRTPVSLLTTHGADADPGGLREALPDCDVRSFPFEVPKQGGAGFAAALMRSWLSRLPVDLWRWRVPALRGEVERRLSGGGVDLCVADFLTAVPNLPPDGPVPVVLFEHNVEHQVWRRLASVESRAWRRWLLEIEWRKMRRFEAAACARSRLTVAVSPADRERLSAIAPAAQVVSIPTGVDTSYFQPGDGPETPGTLVFTGSMDWYPNEDGILNFIETTLPRIEREVPGSFLTVVGRRPSQRLRAQAAAARVRVTGTVDDVRPHMAEAAVYVVPLRVGGGTRLKIFEALAMGKAVVSTGVGAEGLPLVPGRHALIADSPAEFADAVVGLLRDPDRRQALGQAGRRLVEERFSWRQVAREFGERLKEAAAPCA
jgi:glycosyltransferase involved in cell wall biosynthesis